MSPKHRAISAVAGAIALLAGIPAVALASDSPQSHTAPPLACSGAIDPVLGGRVDCKPWMPTSSASIYPSPTTATNTASPSVAATSGPTATPTTPKPSPTSPKPTPSSTTQTAGSPGGIQVKALITGYGAPDNTPPGSSEISNPVLHQTAGGDGSFGNPLTVAVGHTLSGGKDILDWPAGTRWYDPLLKAYFLVEDTCGDGSHPQDGPCHVVDPDAKAAGAVTWLDVWVGGVGRSSKIVLDCEDTITGVRTVILDPPPGLPVIVGDIAGSGGCRI